MAAEAGEPQLAARLPLPGCRCNERCLAFFHKPSDPVRLPANLRREPLEAWMWTIHAPSLAPHPLSEAASRSGRDRVDRVATPDIDTYTDGAARTTDDRQNPTRSSSKKWRAPGSSALLRRQEVTTRWVVTPVGVKRAGHLATPSCGVTLRDCIHSRAERLTSTGPLCISANAVSPMGADSSALFGKSITMSGWFGRGRPNGGRLRQHLAR